jgi:predicted flavoprotein YhiN
MAADLCGITGRRDIAAGADEGTEDGRFLISGGGPLQHSARRPWTSPASSPIPHRTRCRNILRSWPLREQIEFFERDALDSLMEGTGSAKLFPKSESARDVRDRLLALARARGVTIVPGVAGDRHRSRTRRSMGPATGRVTQQDGAPFLANRVHRRHRRPVGTRYWKRRRRAGHRGTPGSHHQSHVRGVDTADSPRFREPF